MIMSQDLWIRANEVTPKCEVYFLYKRNMQSSVDMQSSVKYFCTDVLSSEFLSIRSEPEYYICYWCCETVSQILETFRF